jgi:hypothetical protein
LLCRAYPQEQLWARLADVERMQHEKLILVLGVRASGGVGEPCLALPQKRSTKPAPKPWRRWRGDAGRAERRQARGVFFLHFLCRDKESGMKSPYAQKTTCVVFLCLFCSSLPENMLVTSTLTVTEGGAEANDGLGFSALLWSLVSPRDLTKSPDRFTDKGLSRKGNTGEQGVAHGASFSFPVRIIAEQRGG